MYGNSDVSHKNLVVLVLYCVCIWPKNLLKGLVQHSIIIFGVKRREGRDPPQCLLLAATWKIPHPSYTTQFLEKSANFSIISNQNEIHGPSFRSLELEPFFTLFLLDVQSHFLKRKTIKSSLYHETKKNSQSILTGFNGNE